MKIFLMVVVSLALASQAMSLDKWPLSTRKKSLVVMKIPAEYLGQAKDKIWGAKIEYSIDLGATSNGQTTVNGDVDWIERGWPNLREFVVDDAFVKGDRTVVELKSIDFRTDRKIVRLLIDTSQRDADFIFASSVFVGGLSIFKKSEYYKDVVERIHLPRIFAGPLSRIPRATQLRLIEASSYEVARISGEEFRGKFYLRIAQYDDFSYNTLRVNQSERVARAVENIIAQGIKDFADFKVEGLDGIKIEHTNFFRNFLDETENKSEVVSVYFTLDQLARYKEADITNQQLIDASFVFVDGNRVQVSLTQFK